MKAFCHNRCVGHLNQGFFLNKRLPSAHLYEKDEFSPSWGEHQVWRLQKLMELESSRTGVPVAKLRLAYHDKTRIELMGRQGERVIYRPQGVINSLNLPESDSETMSFEVSWIDPWGFFHQRTAQFTEIRFEVLDEFTFMRRQKLVNDARAAMISASTDTPSE